MLIIPFDRAFDWRRPPVVTLLLILANVLGYFLFQLDDDARFEDAARYYYSSELHQFELPRYRDELRARGDSGFVDRWEASLAEPNSPWLWRMQSDGDFMRRLRSGQIISADAPEYFSWQRQRQRFDAMLDRAVTYGWGFKPADASPATVFSHMFLHGGVGHLLGNMLFLLAVGFLVEGALGRWSYLGAYLLGGLGAVGLFWALNQTSGVPLVGASGAVSGLMGMYAVLFGRRRIRFFYFVGVYFDYVKAPAATLLALWVGYELLQYFWLSPQSNVAYMAHVGGLISGAGIALALKRIPGAVDFGYLEANERKQAVDGRRQLAADHMARLDFDKALPVIEALLAEQPEDEELLRAALSCTRFQPASEGYHRAVHRILTLPDRDADAERWIAETYRQYLQQARPKVRLPAALVRRLLARFIRSGEFDEAEKLLRIMLRNAGAFPDAPAYIGRLANAMLRRQQAQRAQRYFQLLLERYPDSQEAAAARQVIGV